MSAKKYRLVTRSDFDGLVCAVLLKELDILSDILFVHPKDMQDGKIPMTDNDISTNLPYVPGCFLAFDHHHSETLRRGDSQPDNHIIDAAAPSAARVVYDYYGGKARFPTVSEDLMAAVDKSDAARFSLDEILHPDGWVLLNYLMDARTGLGRFRDFRISNYQLMMALIDACRTLSIEQILELPDVRERVELFRQHEAAAKQQILRCSTQHGPLVVLDLRHEDCIHPCNRFLIYALFPQSSISIHVLWGLKQQNTVFAIGKSIVNRESPVNIGELALRYGGGGHQNAGTCQVANDQASQIRQELIEQILHWPDPAK